MTKEKKSMAKHMFGNNIQEINEFLADAFKDKKPTVTLPSGIKLVKKIK